MAEVMVGASGYNGDLTQRPISPKVLRPGANINFKYNSGDFLNFRIGIGIGKVGFDDKNNTKASLRDRNLNFKSSIIEFNVCSEFVLLDPEIYLQYPYLFAGIGLFHFNPYTYDRNGKKVFLPPLSTEGEGLSEYPDRKKYSLTQLCLPFGAGFKFKTTASWELSFEFGYRVTFTDYIDDVSKNYVSPVILKDRKGPTAAELAYRGPGTIQDGNIRGSSKAKDYYFFTGMKIAINLSKPTN